MSKNIWGEKNLVKIIWVRNFLAKKTGRVTLREGFKKKNYWKIQIRGGGGQHSSTSARVDFRIRKKKHMLKTLEIAYKAF